MSEPRGEPYSWALLRIVPRAERGERINVGAAVYARRPGYLGLSYELDERRLRALDPRLDLDALRRQLDGLRRVADGDPDAGRVAAMSPADRFGFIVAPSSTVLQPSPVHVGICPDDALTTTLDELIARYIRL
ncbi:MAG: DUF3037 domain-containing protein [Patulibacter sp.]